MPAEQWLGINAGDGSKGKRFYDWTRVVLWRPGWPANVGFWLLARRKISDLDELAYYVCFAPAGTSLVTLVRVAGCRWRVEEAFEQAKGEVGLDLWVPVIRFMSCDLRILMDQPAESIPSGNPSSRRDDRWFGGPKRWGLPKARCGRWPL